MTESSPTFEVTACVLVHRDDHWLLSVRRPDLAYAPGRLGLIGGHVELGFGVHTLEQAARREVAEETGIDLSDVPLHYLESLQYAGRGGLPSVDVTFVAEAPPDVEPELAAPEELTAVGWCTAAEVAADPRAPGWLAGLLERARVSVLGIRG